jgi:hypothetical protein
MLREVVLTLMSTPSRFPPANAKLNIEASKDAPLAVLPSSSLAQSDIWNSQERDSLKAPRYKKKDLDDRRSKVLTRLLCSFRRCLFLYSAVGSRYWSSIIAARRSRSNSTDTTLPRVPKHTIKQPGSAWLDANHAGGLVHAVPLFLDIHRDSRRGS